MMKISMLFYNLDDFFSRHTPGQRIITKASCSTVAGTFVCVPLLAQQWHHVGFALQLFPSETKLLIMNGF